MSKKVTIKNFETVLENIKTMFNENEDDQKFWCEAFNDMLDELRSDDFFGTEGELDPRGDNRD